MFDSVIFSAPGWSEDPGLATKWDWSNNFKTVTLQLRKNVKFQDGSDFNSTALKWNLEKHMAAKLAGSAEIDTYEIVDDYTFRINIKEYQNTWFPKLYGVLGYMISPTAVQKNGIEWANWNPVGTGPFKFKSFKENDSMEMVRYDDYWGKKPYLDGIKFVLMKDAVSAQIAFEAGEADMICLPSQMPKISIDLLSKGKGYKTNDFTGMSYILVPSSGVATSPFANIKVRQATEYAIDKDKIASSINKGYSKPMYQRIASHHPEYNPNYTGLKYDLEKAKQLLTEAGFSKGFKTKLYCSTNSDEVGAIQAYLKAVGIDADIEVVSGAKASQMLAEGFPDGLYYTAWPSIMSYNYCLSYFKTPSAPNAGQGWYWTALKRPTGYDDLVKQILAEPDYAKQTAIGKQIAQLESDNAFVVPLWEAKDSCVMQKYVQGTQFGVRPDPLRWGFSDTWMDK
jgi:ABC-type transport system substrate-binding protein